MTIDATAPIAIPCRRRFSDSPWRIEGTCMVFPFARLVSEPGHGHPDGFRFNLNWRPNALGWRIDYYSPTPFSVRNLSKIAHTRRFRAPPHMLT